MVAYYLTSLKILLKPFNSHSSWYFWRREYFIFIWQHLFSKHEGSMSGVKKGSHNFWDGSSTFYKKYEATIFWKGMVSNDIGEFLILPNTKYGGRYDVGLLHIPLVVHWCQSLIISRNIGLLIIFYFHFSTLFHKKVLTFRKHGLIWSSNLYWCFLFWKLLAGSRKISTFLEELSFLGSWSLHFSLTSGIFSVVISLTYTDREALPSPCASFYLQRCATQFTLSSRQLPFSCHSLSFLFPPSFLFYFIFQFTVVDTLKLNWIVLVSFLVLFNTVCLRQSSIFWIFQKELDRIGYDSGSSSQKRNHGEYESEGIAKVFCT